MGDFFHYHRMKPHSKLAETPKMRRLTAKIINNGPLTDKEAQVLRYLAMGYYRPEIALHLHRTLSTISKHIEHIAEKLEAHGSTEIVLIAEKKGIVEIKLSQTTHPLLLCLLIICQLSNLNLNARRPPQTPRPLVRQIRSTKT